MALYEQNKTSLSLMDTKMSIVQDGITTWAYGHYHIHREEFAIVEEYINDLFGDLRFCQAEVQCLLAPQVALHEQIH